MKHIEKVFLEENAKAEDTLLDFHSYLAHLEFTSACNLSNSSSERSSESMEVLTRAYST